MSVSIKLQSSDDVRRVTVLQTISYNELKELTRSLFSNLAVDWEKLSFRYLDNENDLCSVTGELELKEAFLAKKQDVLKLELCFRNPSQVVQPTSPTFVLLERLAEQQQHRQFESNRRSFQQEHQHRLQQLEQLQQQRLQQQSPGQARKCWPERINQRRMQIIGFHEEAIALMEQKKYEEAKALFTQQAEILRCPWKKSVPLYNIACCEALLGNVDSALATLSQAVNSGYRNVAHIESDEDLKSLRGLDAFEVLISELKSNPQSQKKRECRWNARFARGQQQQQQEEEPSTSDISPKSTQEIKSTTVEVKPEVVEVKPEIIDEIKPEIVDEVKPVVIDEVKTVVNEVKEVVSEPQPQQQSPIIFQEELSQLAQMGFLNERKNLKALRRANGNLSQAVVFLLR